MLAELETIAREIDETRRDLSGVTDEGEVIGPVRVYLDEARARLNRSSFDVGVFGQVKRGKSTLVNALIGREVSSMRVTPETAVPVIVSGPSDAARVTFADGRVEEVHDPSEVLRLCGHKEHKRRARNGEVIVRVEQRVDSWLPQGVRLVDTPGITDPKLAEQMRERALAEMDRVAASVVVFMSPPGVDQDDEALLSEIADRSIDKVFLVCNFHGEQWRSLDERQRIKEAVFAVVARHGTVNPDDLRIYEVNAKAAWNATTADDDEGLEASGLLALRSDLETFLSGGAMQRETDIVHARVRAAAGLLAGRLTSRVEMLTSESALKSRGAGAEERLRGIMERYEELAEDLRDRGAKLVDTLLPIASAPFDDALRRAEGGLSKAGFSSFHQTVNLWHETAMSRLAQRWDLEFGMLSADVQRRLDVLIGEGEAVLAGRGSGVTLATSPIAFDIEGGIGTQDMGNAVLAGAAVGVAGGAIGGVLGGGAGIALLALGPAGWIAGAAIGLIAGAALGLGAALHSSSARISAEDCMRLTQQLVLARATGLDATQAAMTAEVERACQRIERVGEDQAVEVRAELHSIRELASNGNQRQAAIDAGQALLERIERLVA